MTDHLHFAAPGPAGPDHLSPRGYTSAEIAAASRRGYVHGSRDRLGGPLFWATGDWHPSEIRQALADYRLLAAAVEREWPKEWP